jgi:hypothetical protein
METSHLAAPAVVDGAANSDSRVLRTPPSESHGVSVLHSFYTELLGPLGLYSVNYDLAVGDVAFRLGGSSRHSLALVRLRRIAVRRRGYLVHTRAAPVPSRPPPYSTAQRMLMYGSMRSHAGTPTEHLFACAVTVRSGKISLLQKV